MLDSSFLNCRIIVAQYCRTACAEEVDVLVAVDVIKIFTLCFCKNKGERIVECKIVLNTTRDDVAGF